MNPDAADRPTPFRVGSATQAPHSHPKPGSPGDGPSAGDPGAGDGPGAGVADEVRLAARRFLAEQVPSAEVRRIMALPDGYDPALWRRLADLGLPGVALPEEYGGAGLGLRELTAVLEEAGRALLPAPLLATAIAGQVLLDAGHTAPLPGIAHGTTIATVALDGTVRNDKDVLSGQATHVLDGHLADLVVVASGGELFLVDGTAGGLARTPLDTMDQTRRLAHLTFDRAPATRLDGRPDDARDLAATLLAAEQLGGADRCLEMAVAYAKIRVQFGRPIGTFQAIQHRCADVLVAVETARAATGRPVSPANAAVARVAGSAAYLLAAGENIQIHGGIGITWEHDAHLHLKRARGSATLFGPPARYRDRLAALVLPTAP